MKVFWFFCSQKNFLPCFHSSLALIVNWYQVVARLGFLLLWARWYGVPWWVNSSASPSPFLNLSVVIRALRASVGGWGGRGWLSQALVMLVFQRLGGICGKMERLCQRFQAGRLGRVATRVVATESGASDKRQRAVAALRFPGRFGWLVRLASYHAAGYGSQLRTILGEPEMVELLLAAPQAARILRPLCRMLAVETSLLRPRPAGAAVEIAAEASVAVVKKRVRLPRKVVDWGRIPLPRGVLSAARRQGFGKVR
jgi:hypothetical protein